MASMKDTKNRIGSVKNTQKITRAMKLVSAAKYARANQAAIEAKPYGEAFDRMVARFAASIEEEVPLTKVREEKKILFFLIASDRGLCGGLNSNLFKEATRFLEQKKSEGVEVEMILWGKRAVLFGKKRPEKVLEEKEKALNKIDYQMAKEKAELFAANYEDLKYDGVYIGFSKFANALSQVPTVDKLLPIGIDESDEEAGLASIIVEPSGSELLSGLLAKQLGGKIYRTYLDSAASEHAARMTAMDSATNNADEVIKTLTLEYNRARQAAITTELIEITSGADAL